MLCFKILSIKMPYKQLHFFSLTPNTKAVFHVPRCHQITMVKIESTLDLTERSNPVFLPLHVTVYESGCDVNLTLGFKPNERFTKSVVATVSFFMVLRNRLMATLV